MEPPAKRPRTGPAFFDDSDDPEADELNEAPEVVNARRDPDMKLEQRRAGSQNRLRLSWEHIIGKYERDFTGVSDEVDLLTGKIVVNNGHLESLKETPFGGGDEEDDVNSDEGSEAGSLNEEERAMRGKADSRLSSLGQNASRMILPQIATPPPFYAQNLPTSAPMVWEAPWVPTPPFSVSAPAFGGPPGHPSMMYPWQMPSAGFPMQPATAYPTPRPATDPIWRAPELPSSITRNPLTWAGAKSSVRIKQVRLSQSAARGQNGVEEDDILLAPAARLACGKGQELVVKQRTLLPRPSPDKAPKKRRKHEGVGSRRAQGVKEPSQLQHTGNSADREKQGPGRKHTDASVRNTQESAVQRFNADSEPVDEVKGTPAEPIPTEPVGPAVLSADTPEGQRKGNTNKDAVTPKPAAPESPQRTLPEPDSQLGLLDPADPGVYLKLPDRGEEEGLTRKPGNQTLQVEIFSRTLPDDHSFTDEADIPQAGDIVADEVSPKSAAATTEVQDTEGLVLVKDVAAERRQEFSAVPVEVFSRNTIDPSYAFSDEDEPAVPRKRKSQRKPSKSKPTESTNAEGAVVREVPQRANPGQMGIGRAQPAGALPQTEVDHALPRDPSPPLSLRLDDLDGPLESDLSNPLGEDRDAAREPSVAAAPVQTNDQPEHTKKRCTRSRTSGAQAANHPPEHSKLTINGSVESGNSITLPETHPSKTTRRGRGRPRKSQLQDPPARALPGPKTDHIYPLRRQPRQEIPESPPNGRTAISPPSASVTRNLNIGTSDPTSPFTSEEQPWDVPDQHSRALSPTLTDPSSPFRSEEQVADDAGQPGRAPSPTLTDPASPFKSKEQAPDVPGQPGRAPSPTVTDPASAPQPPRTRPHPPRASSPAPRTPVNRRRLRSHQRQETPSTTTAAAPKTRTSTPSQLKEVFISVPPDDDSDDALSIIGTPEPASSVCSMPVGPSRLSSPRVSSPAPRAPVRNYTRRRPGSRQGTATPSAPTSVAAPKATTSTPSKLRAGVLSLVPADDSDDELSIISIPRHASSASSTPVGRRVRLGLAGTGTGSGSRFATASRLNRKAVLAESRRGVAVEKSGAAGAGGFVCRTPTGRKTKGVGSPGSSLGDEELVQTPGGTMRRCGEGGFRCGRGFCFRCL